MTTVPTTLRAAELPDLIDVLRTQQARKLDVVASAAAIHADGGRIALYGTDVVIDDDGVTSSDGIYLPTSVALSGLAEKLAVPVKYLRRLHSDRPDLFDVNINGLLKGGRWEHDGIDVEAPMDERSFMLRCFRGDDGDVGFLRAFLSPSYKRLDNLDSIMALMAGFNEAGIDVRCDNVDLSDRRMRVSFVAPEITALAPEFLRGYRNPLDGITDPGRRESMMRHGYLPREDAPVIHAGIVATNSETGCGAWSIAPRFVVRVCSNGMTITTDAMREVHLGSTLADGVVDWSDDTQQKSIELIKAQTRDAVQSFLNGDYITRTIEKLADKAAVPVTNPADAIETVSKKLRFTESQQDEILAHFIAGGQLTAGGIAQAVTSAAQVQEDPDTAGEMEDSFLRVLDAAAVAAR